MGIDLYLLPFDCDHPTISFSHTVLTCQRSRELFREIDTLPAYPTPDDFTCFVSRLESRESGYGKATEDCYGDHLTYTTTENLLTLSNHTAVKDTTRNRAIWAYLGALPPQTKVALYWH